MQPLFQASTPFTTYSDLVQEDHEFRASPGHIVGLFLRVLFLKAEFPVSQATLELITRLRMTSKVCPTVLYLQSARITGTHHQTRFFGV